MKTPIPARLALVLALVLATDAASPALAAPLGTGFTYQGELVENGSPVSGTAHLRFRLYDAAGSGSPPAGGNQVGSSQLLADVPVTNGVFSVVLNDAGEFGASAFNGDARWIQLEVCDDAACATFSVLAPRQPVTGVPYALIAAKPWQISGTNLSYSGGNVAVGTPVPANRLHVKAAAVGDGIRLEGAASAAPGYHLFDGSLDRGTLGLATVPGLWSTDALGGDIVLRSSTGRLLLQNGALGSGLAINGNNVGLGTTVPAVRLDVRGDIKLGTTGQYYAPAGEENLRIVRGEIAYDGSSPIGCCFSCVRVSTGVYDITLASPFTGAPVITATPRSGGIIVHTVSLGNGAFRVITYLGGSASNTDFHFIAIGPR